MPIFRIQPPVAVSDPSRVDAWLQAKGYTVSDGSSLLTDGGVLVNTDRDPSADAASYTDATTPAEQINQQAVQAVQAYIATLKAIAPANRTPQQKFEMAVARLVHDLAIS